MAYVRIASWHIATITSRDGTRRATRCGRWAKPGAPEVDDLPGNEASCETCLRYARADTDKAG